MNLTPELIGSMGFIEKTEYTRILIDALNTLGYAEVGTHLEQKSGVDLHNAAAELFLEQAKKGEWDNSIATLNGLGLELNDEKLMKFLLLEQKVLELVKMGNVDEAMVILNNQMPSLGIQRERVAKCFEKFKGNCEKHNIEISRAKAVEKLERLLPAGMIIQEGTLETVLELGLCNRLQSCSLHNDDVSICIHHDDHDCSDKIPSVTLQILKGHTNEVWFVKFSNNGRYLASSSRDKSAIIWEINAEGEFLQKHKLEGHTRTVVAVLWSPDDQKVITCGQNENIRLWDVDTGACVRVFEKDGVGSVSCGWIHDGTGIIGEMTDRCICLWDLNGTEREQKQQPRIIARSSDVAMTSDGKLLVSMGRTANEISLYDFKTEDEKFFEVEGPITSFSLSKTNNLLLVDLPTGKIDLWQIQGHQAPFKRLEFSGHKRRNGDLIIRSCFGGFKETFFASGCVDSQVYIWHRSKPWEPCRVLSGHQGMVYCVSWNPANMHMLASSSGDRSIRIWGVVNTAPSWF